MSSTNYNVSEDEQTYWVELPLRNRFENVGLLKLSTPKHLISKKLIESFIPVFYSLIGIAVLYFLFLFLTEHRWGDQERRWLQTSYGFVFFVMAVIVVLTLVNTYSEGIQERTKALAQSLAQRLNQVVELGIDISDISGLQSTLTEYKQLNPDISYVALTSGERIVIHTNPGLVDTKLQPLQDHFEYALPLSLKGKGDKDSLILRAFINVGIPKALVYSRLWRNIKNFSVLFIASAFISFFFLDVLLSVRRSRRAVHSAEEDDRDLKVELVRPVFFLGVFIEGIHVSFLPQYFQQIAVGSGVDATWASTLFTLFFAAFALTLLPAGRYAETHGVKRMMVLGILLASLGLGAMAVTANYYLMGAIRILAGIGQGLIFIGCQSYIVTMASQAKKTQGAAIIVFGYNGGFISGAAIGALVVTYIGPSGVFTVAGILGGFLLIYALSMISEVPQTFVEAESDLGEAKNKERFLANIGKVLGDLQFCKTILLVGITTKAVLTGVTIFALPLLMANAGYAQEDIGQILMFYSGGVLLSSQFISKLVDRTGRTREILFLGTVGSGFGLIMIGMLGWENLFSMGIPMLATGVLILGMLVLGLAHGFINAPIITHIANTSVSQTLGRTSTISLYRFLERVGHVLGPIIVAQLLIANQQNALTISWIGGATLLFAVLFMLLPGGTRILGRK